MSNRLPLPGDLIDGRYRVQRALGAGSMGAVYEATHHVTGKRFALKWLMPELTNVHGVVERFIREAQIGARFDHPNLVEVYDMGQDAGSLYIVMELLEGEPLSERLARVRRLSPRAACELLCPCMEAVALAHEAGVIHRDLKPANIFVCEATSSLPEHARVLDFGISKLEAGSQLDRQHWMMTSPLKQRSLTYLGASSAPLAALRSSKGDPPFLRRAPCERRRTRADICKGSLFQGTRPGMVLGTPEYMAPEQMRGAAVDVRADVYGFGVILYEALSGEPPFKADSFAELVAQVLTEAPRSLERLAALPEGLPEIVAKAIAREPADRFDSMASLLKALAPFRARSEARRPTLRCVPDLGATKVPSRFEDAAPRGLAAPDRGTSSQVAAQAEVPRPPRNSNAASISAFLAALAFVVAGTWATNGPADRALEAAEAALQDSELADEEPTESSLEANSAATKVREIEVIADARVATKAANAARAPERGVPRRPTTSARTAEDPPATVREHASADTLEERPISFERLKNGLIDPFGTR